MRSSRQEFSKATKTLAWERCESRYRPLAGTKRSGWKRSMDGTVSRRET